jgi:HEAT repeat protein
MDRNAATDATGVGRTAQDACSTLVELERALKGWVFYAAGQPVRADLLDRAWRVLRGEIGRSGPLALEVRGGAFALAGTEVPIAPGRPAELARRLAERGVDRICFDAEIDAASLAGLLDGLVVEPDAILGCFEDLFHDGTRRGIRLNDADWRARLASVPDADEALALEETQPSFEADDEILDFVTDEDDAEADATPIDLLDELDPESERPAPPAPPTEPELDAEPAIDELGEHLRELDECESDARYRDAARQLVFEAKGWLEACRFDDVYRVLSTFAAHTGDDGKRSFAQRDSAQECLLQLGQGAALGDLVQRACDADADTSLRAVDVLRGIGAPAATRVLEEIVLPGDTDRRAKLGAFLLAMGEDAVPALVAAMSGGPSARQRIAVRLAGETQNPRLVPDLADALFGASDDVAREAAQSLVRIGDVLALEVLAEALGARPAIAACAAHALGGTGRVLAVAPLVAALDRALDSGATDLARDVVRALGRLARPESVPALAGLITRGGFLQRRKLRELKLGAITALTHVPGAAAEEALQRAAKLSDASLKQAAQLALRRRPHERS